MQVWVVVDRYDHSETITSVHMTEKGAMIQAYNILFESYDSLCEHDKKAELDETQAAFKEEYPAAYEFVESYRMNIEEAMLADLTKHESDFGCFVGEWTDWATNVEVQVARLQG